nr:CHASE2 domain-containing protein [uncultured Roseateles sp.]
MREPEGPAAFASPSPALSRLGLAWVPLGALLLTALLWLSPWQRNAADWLADAQTRTLARPSALQDLVVVDIDEASLQQLKPYLGAWPYRRDAYALVINYLREAGARLIALNIVFADEREGDAALRQALQAPGAPVLLAARSLLQPLETESAQAQRLERVSRPAVDGTPAMRWPGLLLPAEPLLVAPLGMVSTPLDTDGLLRRLPVLHQVEAFGASRVLPALPVAVHLQLQAESEPVYRPGRFLVKNRDWPVDETGAAAIALPSNAHQLTVLPFGLLAQAALGTPLGSVSDLPTRAAFKDRIVFIGSSALSGDGVMTPAGQFSGTAWLALAYAQLREGRILHPPGWAGDGLLLAVALLPVMNLWRRGRPSFRHDAFAAGLALLAVSGLSLGALAWLQWQTQPLPPLLLIASGGLLAALAQQRHTQAQNQVLAQQRAMAEAANRAKTEFLANMSHELRTPLNGVIGAAQLLQDQGEDPQRRQELVDIIRFSGASLLDMIDSVLDLARIEAGVLELSTSDFNLADCVEAAVATAAVPARGKGVQMACILAPELGAWRHGDAARLRQVLLNLLGNAVKFTLRGEVVLRIGAGEGGPEQLRFEISDTGIGMDEAALARVFEPFRQADAGTKKRFGGSGLGLTICRRVVLNMGGQIAVRSTPGQGSVFSVALPLPLATEPVAEPAPLGLRVAFFEPHPPSAEGLTSLLQRMGCEPLACSTAPQLRALFEGVPPHRQPSWLLVSADSPLGLPLLEAAEPWLNPERVIGMTQADWYRADAAREQFRLPRSLIKPVLRAQLVSRFGAVPRLATERPAAAPAPVPSRILIVEDDLVNQTIVSAMLNQAGFQTLIAGDGQTALQLVNEQEFDLLLMDWQMPDMDGLEVTRRLRSGAAGPRGRHVPIVALTANAFAEDRATCLAAGMNDFLTKPVVARDLVATVLRWSGMGRP